MKQYLNSFLSRRSQQIAFLLILIAVFFHFYKLTAIPTMLSQDQLIYAANAQAVAHYWSDLSNTWNPASLTPFDTMFAELPAVIMAPAFFLPISPVLAARITFAVFGLGIAFLLAQLSSMIFKKKELFTFVLIISLFNPWMFQMSRFTFDVYISMFFTILGTVLFLQSKKYLQALSILPFFLAFYQYQGHKLVLIPWIALFFIYSVLDKKSAFKTIKKLVKEQAIRILVFLFSMCMLCFYLLVQLPTQSAKQRVSSIVTPSADFIVFEVNTQRRLSLLPELSFYYNKYTIWMKVIISNTFQTLNPSLFFWEGQGNNSSFSLWEHGMFYLIDSLLIITGIYFLFKNKKQPLAYLFLALCGASTLPSVLNTSLWVFFRNSMMYTILILIISYALYNLRAHRKIFLTICILYSLSIANFLFLYFNSYPTKSSNSIAYPERVLASYLNRLPQDQKIIILSKEPQYAYTSYIFYNDLIGNPETKEQISKSYRKQEFSLGNITFESGCIPSEYSFDENTVYVVKHDSTICRTATQDEKVFSASYFPELRSENSAIGGVIDSGETYKLFNDMLCTGTTLPDFIYITELDQFDLDSLTTEEFCSTWILK